MSVGMYTEIIIKADVKADAPDSVKAILRHLFNRDPQPDELPDHEFFRCDRWSVIGSCSSYYHVPWSDSRYKEDRIFSRSDLKNYDDEIDKFFDWVRPYLDEYPEKCIGWSWYEEADAPTLVFKGADHAR